MGLCWSRKQQLEGAIQDLQARVSALEQREYPVPTLSARDQNTTPSLMKDAAVGDAEHIPSSNTTAAETMPMSPLFCKHFPVGASISTWPGGDEGTDYPYRSVGRYKDLGMIGSCSMTFETWVCLDQLSIWNNQAVFGSTTRGHSLHACLAINTRGSDDQQHLVWSFWGVNHIRMPFSPRVGSWFHLAASYDFDLQRLQLICFTPNDDPNDVGNFDDELIETVDGVPPLQGNAMVQISRSHIDPPDVKASALRGRLAVFRLWNYARSQAETAAQRSVIVLPEDDTRLTYRLE